jgi:hypothetical protein
VLGDVIGVRSVYLAAAAIVLLAALISVVLFRGVPRRPTVTDSVAVEATST